MNLRPPIPKPEPLTRQRTPTTDELREIVAWGLRNGLLKWPEPPSLDTEAKDFSPDLKRHLAEKEAEMRKQLDGGP